MSQAHFEAVLRLGDNALILGQRLSEWCGHSPFLEEDIAIANTALDHIGRARMLLSHAGELEGRGRSEDDLAYFRDEREFRNFLMVELPIGDFAFTLVRQFLLDVYHHELYARLKGSTDATLAGIAAKAVKECAYHVRRSGEWVLRLGDGTTESHDRAQPALDELWGFSHELFAGDAVDRAMADAKIAPDLAVIYEHWRREVEAILIEATLQIPDDGWQATGGREGVHTEHMGHLLAELQVLQRAYPELEW
ncbi:MAG: phenylacetate-CoA oxygenase subunit PaaC [Gammaproteobacteria bacterium]|nr:phenylacetate-CoA oxygenase subunit PaaC [Gammaproteobacteria bacterium]